MGCRSGCSWWAARPTSRPCWPWQGSSSAASPGTTAARRWSNRLEPRPQDWRVLLGMFCFSSVIEITAWGHLQAFAPLFLDRELGMDAANIPFWTGVLAALPLCVAVPLAPFWGVLADRYSRKLF